MPPPSSAGKSICQRELKVHRQWNLHFLAIRRCSTFRGWCRGPGVLQQAERVQCRSGTRKPSQKFVQLLIISPTGTDESAFWQLWGRREWLTGRARYRRVKLHSRALILACSLPSFAGKNMFVIVCDSLGSLDFFSLL